MNINVKLLVAACATALLGGCQKSDPGANGAQLSVLFPTMYSSFDGVHSFQVPAVVDGIKGATWSASDPSVVQLDPSADGASVMMTTKKAGQVTITATAGGITGSASLTVASTTSDLWDIGNKRYNNGIVPPPRDHDAGWGAPMDGGVRMMQACANCHANGAQDIEHTPEQTAGYSDADLIMIMTQGMKPAGVPQRIMPFDRWHMIHQWVMTDDEKNGLVVYLRALMPESQGPVVDWGGHGHHDGGM